MKGPVFISLLSLLIVISYIIFNEAAKPKQENILVEMGVPGPSPLASSISIPEEMYFAGERVPLEMDDVKERLDRELHINAYWHNNTIFLLKRANRWLPVIEEILIEEGVPTDFKYLPAIEGSFLNEISPKAAVGFWQIRKGTGKELGLEINKEVDERYSPIRSTYAACKYLKKAYEKFGNWTLVAASYNRGVSGINKALNNQKVDSYYDLRLNDETSRYVFRILAAKEILQNPSKYGFDIEKEHLYEPYQVTSVQIDESIPDLIDFAKANEITYKELLILNPWLRTKKLTISKGNSYTINLPIE